MSSITCPGCSSPVLLRRFFNVAGKPFCTRCGWNLDRAEAALAGKNAVVKLLPIGMVAVGLFGVFVATRANSPVIFIIPALFALVALIPLWSYYSVRKAVAEAKSTVNPRLALAQSPIDPTLQMLQSLPRPRRVGFRFRGNLSAAVVAIAVLLAFGVFALTARKGPATPNPSSVAPQLLPVLFMLTFVVIIIAIPFVRDRHSMPLLRDGELAFGRVTGQQTIEQGKASYSRIDYEFQSNTGQTVRNSVRDLTSTIFEDMTIPVFYDPLDSSKNITPCATYLKIGDNPF